VRSISSPAAEGQASTPALTGGRTMKGIVAIGAVRATAHSEWHRWFAWYPVIVWIDGKRRRVWLRYVERHWGTSRLTGERKWALSPSTPAEPHRRPFVSLSRGTEHQDRSDY
jgi:hypothetical protein